MLHRIRLPPATELVPLRSSLHSKLTQLYWSRPLLVHPTLRVAKLSRHSLSSVKSMPEGARVPKSLLPWLLSSRYV